MIGCVLSYYFLQKNYIVVGIDNLSGGSLNNVPRGIMFYPVSICDVNSINLIFGIEKPDYVIHCAAYASQAFSSYVRNFTYTNNVVGSMNIINACVNNDVKKLINFSSIATYGDEATPPFKETDSRIPKTCYGISKLTVELDLKEAYERFGLKSASILPHNVISKYQNYQDRYRNVVAIWIRQCLDNEDVTVYGDGSQKRSFSDCKFLCAPVEKLLDNHDNEIFNVGSDETVTITEAAELVLCIGKRFGSTSRISHIVEPMKEIKVVTADHTKAKNLLGFKDETNLSEIVEEMFLYAKGLPKTNLKYVEGEINKRMYSLWKK